MSPPPPFLCSLTELLVKSSSFKLCDRFLFLLVNFFNICALSRWDRMSVFKQKAVSLCVVHIFGDSVKLIWVKTTTSSFTLSSLITLPHICLPFSADCGPQPYKTLSILTDTTAPLPGCRAEGLWPGTPQSGSVLWRDGPGPGPRQSPPPSPPSPLP